MTATDAAMTQLKELAELGMVAVRKLSTAIEAADDPRTLCDLVDAHCKVGRSIRQSIALRLRIASGSFDTERAAPREADLREEAHDPPDRLDVERVGWNEYERPDWNTPVRLTEETFEADVAAAVVHIRKGYAQGLRVLDRVQPGHRTALLGAAAHLRLVDSS